MAAVIDVLVRQQDEASDSADDVIEREFHLDKTVLMSKSRYFEAMFNSEMSEARTNHVVIEVTSLEDFEMLLLLLNDEDADVVKSLEDAERLLAVALRFQADSVCALCFGTLTSMLTIDNAFHIFSLLFQFINLPDIEALENFQICARFVALNFEDVCASSDCLTCSSTEIHKVLFSLESLNISSDVTWCSCVLTWAQRHLTASEISHFIRSCAPPSLCRKLIDSMVQEVGGLCDTEERILQSSAKLGRVLVCLLDNPKASMLDDVIKVGSRISLSQRSSGAQCITRSQHLQDFHGFGVCSVGDRWYIVGAESKFRYDLRFSRLVSFSVYDKDPCGTVLAKMPISVRNHGCCTDGRRIFVVEWTSTWRVLSGEVFCYDIKSDHWQRLSSLANLPDRIVGLKCAAADGLLLVFHPRTPCWIYALDVENPGAVWNLICFESMLYFLFFAHRLPTLLPKSRFFTVSHYNFVACCSRIFLVCHFAESATLFPKVMILEIPRLRRLLDAMKEAPMLNRAADFVSPDLNLAECPHASCIFSSSVSSAAEDCFPVVVSDNLSTVIIVRRAPEPSTLDVTALHLTPDVDAVTTWSHHKLELQSDDEELSRFCSDGSTPLSNVLLLPEEPLPFMPEHSRTRGSSSTAGLS